MAGDIFTPERIASMRSRKDELGLDDEALSLLESKMPQLAPGQTLAGALQQPAAQQAPNPIQAFKDDVSQGASRLSQAFGGEPVNLAADAPAQEPAPSASPPLAVDAYRNAPSADEIFDESRYASAIGAIEQGNILQAQAAQMFAEGESNILRSQIEQQEEVMKDQQMREIARQKHLEDKQRELDDAVSQFEDADIDPSRLFTEASTASKVMGAISMALGAFGASANGGENRAATIIRNAIEQDVAIQKAEIAKMGDMVTARRNLLQDMRLRFSDEREAEAATKLAMLNQAELQIKALSSQYKGPVAQAEAMKAIGALQLEKEKLRSDYMKQAALANFRGRGGVPEEIRDVYVPGYGVAPTKEEAVKFRELVGSAITAKKKVQRLIELSQQTGKSFDIAGARAEAESLQKMLVGELRVQIVGPGAMNEAELKILEDLIANPTRLFSIDKANQRRLRTLLEAIDQGLEGKAEALGMTPEGGRVTFKED
jgi:hypothetical protein